MFRQRNETKRIQAFEQKQTKKKKKTIMNSSANEPQVKYAIVQWASNNDEQGQQQETVSIQHNGRTLFHRIPDHRMNQQHPMYRVKQVDMIHVHRRIKELNRILVPIRGSPTSLFCCSLSDYHRKTDQFFRQDRPIYRQVDTITSVTSIPVISNELFLSQWVYETNEFLEQLYVQHRINHQQYQLLLADRSHVGFDRSYFSVDLYDNVSRRTIELASDDRQRMIL